MRAVNRWKALAATAVVLACAAGLRAEDPPDKTKPGMMQSKAHDKAIHVVLREVINHGADLYNPPNSDWNGCYRLYEGALMTIKPMLVHRPALQKVIATGIQTARLNPSMDRRAFDLRMVIDRVRNEVNPNPVKPKPKPVVKSLWDRLGGETGVKKVVNDFVTMAAADKKVDFFRGKPAPDAKGVAHLKKQLVDFVHDVTKSPDDKTKYYTGKNMKAAHKGMFITNAQFDALAADLKKALADNGVKADDAKALLDLVETTRKDVVEGSKPKPPTTKSLWERLGGEAGVTKVVDDFTKIVTADKKVDFFRGKPAPAQAKVDALKKSLVNFIHQVTKSPDDKMKYYTGNDMKTAHKGMLITNAQFDAAVEDLKKALDDNKVKPEDAKAFLDVVKTTRAAIVEGPKPKPPDKKETGKE